MRSAANINCWIANHQRLILLAIVGASIILRLACFRELNAGPCLWQHRWDQTDMNFFDRWARVIAGGDWLTDQALHPIHQWHRAVAEACFRLYPEAVAAFAPKADPVGAIWNHWYGEKTFHQEPLYPYLMALTYAVFGPDARWVYAWQMLLGVAGNVLIYLLARRCFGPLVAAVAGALAVLYSPFLFGEVVLLRETLITVTGLGLIYLADRAWRAGRWRAWLLVGASCGAAILLKSTFILFALGLACVRMYHWRRSPPALDPAVPGRKLDGKQTHTLWKNVGRTTPGMAVADMAALALGILLCLAPLIARNMAVGAPPTSITSVGAVTFVQGNLEDYPPEVGFFLSMKHTPRILAATDGHFMATVIATLKTHPDLASYIALLGRKFAVAWHWYELSDNANFYYYRLHSKVLRYLPITFLVLAPLSIIGLLLALPRLRDCWPLLLMAATCMASLLLFHVLGRYRLPLAALLIPFAALTVVRIAEWAWAGQWGRALAAVAGVAVLSFWTMRPLPYQVPLIRPADYIVAYTTYYTPLTEAAISRNDWPHAATILGDSLRYEPELLRIMGTAHPAMNPAEAQMAAWYAQVHWRYAQALQKAGQVEMANDQAQRAATLARTAEAWNQ